MRTRTGPGRRRPRCTPCDRGRCACLDAASLGRGRARPRPGGVHDGRRARARAREGTSYTRARGRPVARRRDGRCAEPRVVASSSCGVRAPKLHDVAPEEQRPRPVGDDPDLAADHRQRVQVVGPRDEPAEEPAKPAAQAARRSPVASQRRDLAEHPIAVASAAPSGSSRGGAPGESCWQVGGSNWSGVRVLGTAAQSPSDHTSVVPVTRQRWVDRDAAAVVEREAEVARGRGSPHACGPDERPRELVPSERTASGRRTTERRRTWISTLASRAPDGCTRPACAGSREDRRGGVDEYPPLADVAQRGIRADGLVGEVVELGERLHPAYPAPTKTKPRSAPPLRSSRAAADSIAGARGSGAPIASATIRAPRPAREFGHRERARTAPRAHDRS